MNRVSNRDTIENRDKELVSQIMTAVKTIKHGYILITIHDSEVVQIDKTEKVRMHRTKNTGGNQG